MNVNAIPPPPLGRQRRHGADPQDVLMNGADPQDVLMNGALVAAAAPAPVHEDDMQGANNGDANNGDANGDDPMGVN